MILERLADVIAKRSKLIIVVWIIIVLCSVPFIFKAGEVLDYDTSNMAGPDSESVQGAEMISEYFRPSDINMDQTPLLVVDFNTPEQFVKAENAGGFLSSNLKNYLDSNGNPKITSVISLGSFKSDADPDRGIFMYALTYDPEMVKDNKVIDDTEDLRSFVSTVFSDNGIGDLTKYVTGSPALSYDIEKGASEDIAKIDPFTILLILILVGLFFRSFVTSAMPPITIGAAFGVAMCIMYALGSIMNIFYITEMFLLVSMLGAGCDYCIFILARYREERKNGKDHDGALRESIIWAGESIATSGASVIIGFGAMSICSFSMISTMGIMLAIGIIIALLAALTLITSILSIFGDRLFWPSGADAVSKGWYAKVSAWGHTYFTKSAHASIKYAKVILVAAVLFTIPMAYVALTAESSYDMVGGMSTGEASQGMNEITDYSYGGMIMPDYTVMELNESLGTVLVSAIDPNIGMMSWNESNLDRIHALSSLSSTIADSDDNIGSVAGIYVWLELAEKAASEIPQGSMDDGQYMNAVFMKVISELPMAVAGPAMETLKSIDQLAPFIPGIVLKYDDPILASVMDYAVNYVAGSVGGEVKGESVEGKMLDITYLKYTVITIEESMSDRSMVTITNVDNTISKFCTDNPGVVSKTWLTGGAVVMYEISEQVNSEFVKIEILVVVLIFILLFVVMRSYLTPLRSILTILMSVIWTIALTHLIFGTLLGEGVVWMIPIILLVICLGLGMDYDILLTTRIKENRMHRGMSNDDAITAAVTHSGSVITICGLIMGGAFGTLMLSSTPMLMEFGFALCFAIIVDALLVRTYIVPAAMHLLGDWNWKGPRFMHKKDQ